MKEALLRLDEIPMGAPTGSREKAEFIQSVKDSIGTIEKFYDGFYKFWARYGSPPKTAPPPYNEVAEQAKACQMYDQRFGDTLVLYFCLQSSDGHSPVGAMYALFAACCSLSVLQLASGFPIRGGIDVGAGAMMTDNALHSSAQVKAYMLEGQADYPRILVGSGVEEFLAEVAGALPPGALGDLQRAAIPIVKEFMHTDPSDGRVMLDILGTRFKHLAPGNVSGPIVKGAYEQAEAKHAEFKEKSDAESEKIARKYKKLLDYMERRRYLWNDFV